MYRELCWILRERNVGLGGIWQEARQLSFVKTVRIQKPEESVHEAKKEMRLSYQSSGQQYPSIARSRLVSGVGQWALNGEADCGDIYAADEPAQTSFFFDEGNSLQYNSSPVLDKHNINSSRESCFSSSRLSTWSTHHVLQFPSTFSKPD